MAQHPRPTELYHGDASELQPGGVVLLALLGHRPIPDQSHPRVPLAAFNLPRGHGSRLDAAFMLLFVLRLDKAQCLDALQAEHTRLGSPLSHLGYNGAQARQHVLRLMSSPTQHSDVNDGDEADDQQEEEEEEDEEEGGQQTTVWTRFIGDGQWELVSSNPDGTQSSVILPGLTVDGDGYWTVQEMDGVIHAWQGGTTEAIPINELLSSGSGVLAGHASAPAALAGMRLPADDDEDDESPPPDTMLEYPYIEVVDGESFLHTEAATIPLEPGYEWEILQAPNGEHFLDTKDKDPSKKPRYVNQLERKHLAKTLE